MTAATGASPSPERGEAFLSALRDAAIWAALIALIKARARVGDAVSVHTPRGIEVIEVLAISYPD